MEYPSVSKVYHLGDGVIMGVDQSNSNEDKSCLCMAKFKEGVMTIKGIKYIEKQEDIDKYINKNMAEIHGVFGIGNLD